MKIDAKLTGAEAARREMLRAAAAPAKALAVVAEDIYDFVSVEASKHNKSGALVRSTYQRRVGADDYDVGHDAQVAPYTKFVHWGAPAHVIKPKNKGILRWGAGGMWHFAKKVNHPGNKADPWMTRAAALAPRLFDQHLQAILQQGN